MKLTVWIATAGVALMTAVSAHAAPLDRAKGLVAALEAVKKADEATFRTLDAYFDLDRLVDDAIKSHKDKLKPEQLARFRADFRTLLRLTAYPDSGAFLRKAKKTWAAKGNDVVLTSYVEEDDLEAETTFRFDGAATARVYDVLFDGDSLTADYDNQFGRLIKKKGVDGLLKTLRERVEKKRGEQGKAK